MSRACINCGQRIPKKTQRVRIEPPVEYKAATTKMLMGRTMPDMPERLEKPEGHREVGQFTTTIYTDNPPRKQADCQRFVNGEIVSVRRHFNDEGIINQFSYWDGESYMDEYFHNGACAKRFAYKAARRGVRF
jgi:hypothetical protein